VALFRSSGSGKPVIYEQDFCEYSETFGKQPVLISCDRNFAKQLPTRDTPVCIKVQMEINADPADPELVSEAELAHISHIRSIISQHIKGRYVGQGIVASQSIVFFMIYIPQSGAKMAKTMLEQTKGSTFRRLEYTITPDPEGNQYMEYLYPDDVQQKQIENRRILRSLHGYGDDGTTPRRVCFHVLFPNRRRAKDFADEVAEKGFVEEGITEEPAPEGLVLPRQHLVVSRELPFDVELLDLVDRYLLKVSKKYEGDYQTLETDIV